MRILPVSLKVHSRQTVVIGGGPIGRRKALALHAAGAAVRVIALEPAPDRDSRTKFDWLVEPYRSEHLDGAVLVIAAANSEINAAVAADARARQIWVCDAAHPERGDFTIPAIHRVGELTLAVDTGGASPALAARLRDRFATDIEDTFADWVELLREMRQVVLRSVSDSLTRRALLREFAESVWHDRIRMEGVEATRTAMQARIPSGNAGSSPL